MAPGFGSLVVPAPRPRATTDAASDGFTYGPIEPPATCEDGDDDCGADGSGDGGD